MKAHKEVFRRQAQVFYRIDRSGMTGQITDYLVTKSADGGYHIKGAIPLDAEFTAEVDKLFAEAKVLILQRELDESSSTHRKI